MPSRSHQARVGYETCARMAGNSVPTWAAFCTARETTLQAQLDAVRRTAAERHAIAATRREGHSRGPQPASPAPHGGYGIFGAVRSD